MRTIITSNLSLTALRVFYRDDRIPSRLAGTCEETIETFGNDHSVKPLGAVQ